MNTETMKTFVLLSKNKSYTKTASKLFIAQSTVTTRISELEKELGEQLVIRKHQGLELTDYGKIFLDYASRILALEEEIFYQFNVLRKYETTLRIGATDTLYEYYVKGKINQYLQKHPHCTCKIKIGHSIDSIHMLQDNLLDIVYSFVAYEKKGYICHNLYSDPLVLVTSILDPEYFSGITWKQLLTIRLIFIDFTISNRGNFLSEMFPPHYHFYLEVNYTSKLFDLLLENPCYSIQPLSIVKPYLDSKQLLQIPTIDFKLPEINYYQIYKTNFNSPFL